jgi:mediator of RNA polymerase II transcription subunit 12
MVLILVAAPPQTRPALFTAYMAELPSAPIKAVFDRNSSLALALPQVSPPRRPMALQTADASETIPLDDRPWEMFEQLAPVPRQLKHVEMFLASRPIRDTASVPMTLFNPQLKRDPLPVLYDQEEEWHLSVAERNLGDGQAGEALAAKQASTLLYAMPTDTIPSKSTSTSDKDDGPRSTSSHTPKTESPSTPIPPIPSITPANRPRRSSTRTTKTGGSTKDAIDLEESSSDSDDDGIVVQPPPTKRPRVGSKSNASGSGSAAAAAPARPTVGGKAPAKRTTGGKGVARKATGGKNVGRKAPGGKAPKKR